MEYAFLNMRTKKFFKTPNINTTVHTVLTRISATALIKFYAPQVRRLFEGGAYLKFGRRENLISYSNCKERLLIASIRLLLRQKWR